ncbi:hypothetical protein B0J18DRAFT_422641 [Chaetomium sp. MPI-SDFR-AT-0129]|nr:hypothetical protein B0J18DRAFT_422641 [Chaetomium sp. MPI-SDFR-AT-0129]
MTYIRVAVSPFKSHATPSTLGCKRKVTPSAELSFSKRVFLPFDVRDPGTRISNKEVQDLLRSIFSTTWDVGEVRYRSHLLFQVEQLPCGPWPVTVGGLPFTIASNDGQGRALMLPRQIHGHANIKICQEGHPDNSKPLISDAHLRRLAAEVNTWFEENVPGIRMLELMFTCERTIYIVLEDHVAINVHKNKFPGWIANRFVGYINNRELHRPEWVDMPAKRVNQPQPNQGVIDNTAYDVLRPGVQINSKSLRDQADSSVLSTTAGVLVENDAGEAFMTAASHGIGEDGTVWQGGRADRIIGKAAVEIPFTDISLLKPKKDVAFVYKTFETEAAGPIPKFIRLRTSEDDMPCGPCYLNSPYTGNMVGALVRKSVRLFKPGPPPRSTQRDVRYVVYDWMHTGQVEGNDGKVQPPEGTCGSAVWNDDGVILGFYQHYVSEGPWAGFSALVSASAVVDAGYRLARHPC